MKSEIEGGDGVVVGKEKDEQGMLEVCEVCFSGDSLGEMDTSLNLKVMGSALELIWMLSANVHWIGCTDRWLRKSIDEIISKEGIVLFGEKREKLVFSVFERVALFCTKDEDADGRERYRYRDTSIF